MFGGGNLIKWKVVVGRDLGGGVVVVGVWNMILGVLRVMWFEIIGVVLFLCDVGEKVGEDYWGWVI